MLRCLQIFWLPAACLLIGSSLCAADGKAKPGKVPTAAPVSPEREAAVLSFVHRNHDELETLLNHLKTARPKEYEKAIRELSRATERLTQIHDRDAELYELELKLWKIQSRLQLLSAKLQMGGPDEVKAQIKDALKEQLELRAAMLERQKQRLEQQTKKVNEDLSRLKADEDLWIEKQYDQLTRPVAVAVPDKEPAKEPVKSPPPAKKSDGKNNKPAK